jgi:putative FmdB family regulatory protein
MPIYEYDCGACGDRVEVLVRSSGANPVCPNCGSPLTKKLFSVPNVLSGQMRQPTKYGCCDREERCDSPPCSEGGECWRQ